MRFLCETNGIGQGLTKPKHRESNDLAERMNRTIKDATVKAFHCDSHKRLRAHLADFMVA